MFKWTVNHVPRRGSTWEVITCSASKRCNQKSWRHTDRANWLTFASTGFITCNEKATITKKRTISCMQKGKINIKKCTKKQVSLLSPLTSWEILLLLPCSRVRRSSARPDGIPLSNLDTAAYLNFYQWQSLIPGFQRNLILTQSAQPAHSDWR